MNNAQPWGYPLPESIYNPASAANVSSYFVRPNKVVKSSSRNSSPQTLARRRTTTSATISSRTRSVADHLRTGLQQWQNSAEKAHSRPVSWHPNLFEADHMPFQPSLDGPDLSAWNFATTQVNGLVTPVSYPSINEPHIEELFTPLNELPDQDMAFCHENQPYGESSLLFQQQAKSNPYYFPMYLQHPSLQPSWQINQLSMAPTVQTAPSSPAYLPMQNIGLDNMTGEIEESDVKDGSEELVGMGLYDSPAEIRSSSLLLGGSSDSARKALKLEESFEPTEGGEEVDDDDDDDDDDDEEEEEEAEQAGRGSAKEGIVDETFNSPYYADYESHSIASHLASGMQPDADSLASKYLATLRHLNSAYYPTGQADGGWI